MKKFIVISLLIMAVVWIGIEGMNSSGEIALGMAKGDEYIDSTQVWNDTIKTLKGNLIITSTGNLTLNNVTLIFNCTTDERYHLKVQAWGQLYVYNSNIKSPPKQANYCFWAEQYSTITLENTTISHCGYKGEEWEKGLYIATSNCRINNCTFTNNWYGVYFAAGEPKIENSNIVNNTDYSIKIKPLPHHTAAPYIANNTIISNRFGIYCERDYSVVINNTIAEIEESPIIDCAKSYAYLKDNRIDANGKYVGIQCLDNSNIIISNNTITKASLYGISVFSSRSEIVGNEIANTYVGVYCEASNLTAENNTIKNSSCAAINHIASTGKIAYNNIMSTPLGIYMRHGKATLENNTFEYTNVQVLQEWELKVYVKVWNGSAFNPVKDANVTVKDRLGIEKLNLTTDESGYVIGTITEYEIVNYTKNTYTPHTIKAYKYYVGEASETVEIVENWPAVLELKIADLFPEKLEITGIKSEGEILTIKVNITNKGGLTATEVLVKFLCDNVVFEEELVTVYFGTSTPLVTQWNAVKGTHEIKVEVDPENRIEESDETNNDNTTMLYINFKPIASFNVNVTTVRTYEDILFSASISYDSDGKVEWYWFEFGDGTNSGWISAPQTTHNYTCKGIYYPKLKVKDNFSAESDLFYGASITVNNRPPVANITASKTESYTYEEIIFYATGSYDGEEPFEALYGETGHKIKNYYWDFGDGTAISTLAHIISHNYTNNGIYTVKLIVQDDDLDNSTEETFLIRILNRAPTASFSVSPVTVFVNEELLLNATLSQDKDGKIVNWVWDFGDGTKGYGIVCEHSYTKPHIYTVVLTVFDDDGDNSTYTLIVEVKPLPTWLELHYKEVYIGGAIICIAGAIFFAMRWYAEAKRREEEVRVWAERRGIAKEKALEEKLKEWAEKKKELKGIEARLKDWAKRREEAKRKKELDKWAEKKKLEKEK
ncbi:MAG: PKD domain-containing protein [Candidatus Thermoplasmatota archaeon]